MTWTSSVSDNLAGKLAVGITGVIVATLAASMVAAAGAVITWRVTSNEAWINEFLRGPAALLMLWFAGIELLLAVTARLRFAPDEPMRRVWTLLAISAAAHGLEIVATQILPNFRFNPLVAAAGRPSALIRHVTETGYVLGGSVRFALLTAGVWLAVGVYRRTGFMGRLRVRDVAFLGLFAVYIGRNVADVVVAVNAGKVIGWDEAAKWPTDPLLGILLAMALLLHRCVEQMSGGYIARCWRALSIAIFLTAIGDVGTWADLYGYLPYPWTAIVWCIWLPAAGCFALAPAYQLDAIRYARTGHRG